MTVRATSPTRYNGAMPAAPPVQAADRLRLALDLFAFGESMMRERLRRLDPARSDREIERRLAEWLGTRPGAELGDSAGRSIERLEPDR